LIGTEASPPGVLLSWDVYRDLLGIVCGGGLAQVAAPPDAHAVFRLLLAIWLIGYLVGLNIYDDGDG
jgi:hypothetical protein